MSETDAGDIDPVELLVEPDGEPCGTGVLVLSGSSGALERERAALLAGHGVVALALRWFGGPGQQPAPYEVPLELFSRALDRLAATGVNRIAVLGTSFGAEAALLVACDDPRVDVVVALAPTAVVWAGVDDGRTTSHWTRDGRPVPYVPLDESWVPETDPPAFVGLYRSSLLVHADRVPAATIPVERSRAEVVLVAGEDDAVWPAADFARAIEARREGAGPATTVVVHAAAGHRVLLPGERPVERGQRMARGGSPQADAALGVAAWPSIAAALRLQSAPGRS